MRITPRCHRLRGLVCPFVGGLELKRVCKRQARIVGLCRDGNTSCRLRSPPLESRTIMVIEMAVGNCPISRASQVLTHCEGARHFPGRSIRM